MDTMDAAALAERIGKSADYWTKQARAKRIPHRRLGRSISFTEADVEAILAAALVEPKSTPDGVAPGSASRRAGKAGPR